MKGGAPGRGLGAAAPGPLPSPGVTFAPELLARIGTFASRLSAAREREDVARRRALQGEGEEFAGHRPYRPGEDLRRLDWNLLARLDRPFVRVHRAGSSESWVVLIDSSASMAVGRPGKMQSAAEAAAAAMALGLRLGARIELRLAKGDEPSAAMHLARRSDLAQAVGELQRMDASKGCGLESFLGDDSLLSTLRAGSGRGGRGAGRILLFGDFLDVDPRRVMALGQGRRHVHLGQVFAPEEWDPGARGSVDATAGAAAPSSAAPSALGGALWVDPEHPSAPRPASAADIAQYLVRLEAFVESWSRLARDHRMTHAVWRSDEPFEDHLPALLR